MLIDAYPNKINHKQNTKNTMVLKIKNEDLFYLNYLTFLPYFLKFNYFI